MAVKTKKFLACDVCETEEGVQTYGVRFPGQKRLSELDLCKEHRTPLEDLKKALRGRGRPARGIVAREYDTIPQGNSGG